MCFAVNGQVELPPDSTALFAVFFDLPLAFTEDLHHGGVKHQMRNFTPGLCFKADVNRLSPFTDTTVIRAAQRNARQVKNGPVRPSGSA